MKLLLAVVLSVSLLIGLTLPALKKYRGYILAAYGFIFVLLNLLQTFRTADLMLPFYHAKQQVFYQKEFADEKIYPDALLPLLFKDKIIYTKDDLDEYMAENYQPGDEFKDGNYWLYGHYHQKNMTEFMEAAGAEVISLDEMNNDFISDDKMKDFDFAGYGNDMFRFMFQLSNLEDEWSNYFYYYWFYSYRIPKARGDMNVYINPDGIDKANELVVLWDEKENESIWIMSKDYYDMEVAVND